MDSFVPKSSFLEKVDYDETQYQMTVTFKGGKNQSKYLFVYPATWLSFKQSPDHSSFYSKAIKGKLLSVNVIKHTLGKHKNEPLKEAKIHRPQYRSKGGNKDDSRITGNQAVPEPGKSQSTATASFPVPSDEKNNVKALLAEARNTRDMLVGFRSAVESGSFNGNKMMDLAKGLAFLEAILRQNNAHIHSLQER